MKGGKLSGERAKRKEKNRPQERRTSIVLMEPRGCLRTTEGETLNFYTLKIFATRASVWRIQCSLARDLHTNYCLLENVCIEFVWHMNRMNDIWIELYARRTYEIYSTTANRKSIKLNHITLGLSICLVIEIIILSCTRRLEGNVSLWLLFKRLICVKSRNNFQFDFQKKCIDSTAILLSSWFYSYTNQMIKK